MHDWEEALRQGLDELGRRWLEAALNQRSAAPSSEKVSYQGTVYRRLNEPTPRRGQVATLFGSITLQRHGYRAENPDRRIQSEKTIFPFELQLGLMHGATPALASEIGQMLASTGATQRGVLEQLSHRHHVQWGATRLRNLSQELSQLLTPYREAEQAKQLVQWLDQSRKLKGKNRPSLVVGRDGITLATLESGGYQVASVATFTVYDPKRSRLGTLYLAAPPESGQGALSAQMTSLLQATLRLDCGPVPRLRYLTDAGDNESGYFQQTLRDLRHPVTEKPLEFDWIVDYYHATIRLTTMAEALFAPGRDAESWVQKMRALLRKPQGASRVLHSAAALQAKRPIFSKQRRAAFVTAYNYLRDRLPHLDYHRARSQGLPIGSGVTEAACKTIFTQRLKLSGMRWSHEGAETILNLRVIHLGRIWEKVYRLALRQRETATPVEIPKTPAKIAA